MRTLLLSAVALAAPQLQRVEIIADDPGDFVADELPMLAARPGGTTLRLLAQVQPVVAFGEHVTLGASLSSWTPGWEQQAADHPFGFLVAVPTRLGLPSGLVAAGTYQRGAFWADLGLAVQSGASWRRPTYGDLRVVPTVGLGWVPRSGPQPGSEPPVPVR